MNVRIRTRSSSLFGLPASGGCKQALAQCAQPQCNRCLAAYHLRYTTPAKDDVELKCYTHTLYTLNSLLVKVLHCTT
jgi:hypothetical protein